MVMDCMNSEELPVLTVNLVFPAHVLQVVNLGLTVTETAHGDPLP